MTFLSGLAVSGILSLSVGFPEPPVPVPQAFDGGGSLLRDDLTRLDSCRQSLMKLENDTLSDVEAFRALIRAIESIIAMDSVCSADQKELLRLAHADLAVLEEAGESEVAGAEEIVYELPVRGADVEEEGTSEAAPDSSAPEVAPHVTSKTPMPSVPSLLNHEVESAIHFFQTRGKKVMQRWLDRSATVIPELMPYIREEGFPEEIIFLAMIESGFNYHAYSRAKAVGPWQFIAGTGRRYNLKINKYYDERRDPELSTRAACAYLRDLYAMFDDWYLAMASYNCGEWKVYRHVGKYGPDFWSLTRLPKQTRNYVPTYIAARIIAENPEVYGFWKPEPIEPEPTDIIYVGGGIQLKDLADAAGITLDIFKMMNPALLKGMTPPGMDSVRVRLPGGTLASGFTDRLAEKPASKQKSFYEAHIVRKGETLGAIARKYGVSVDDIVNHPENSVTRRSILRIGQEIIVGDLPEGQVAAAPKKSEPVEDIPQPEPGFHFVRRGENLGLIARKYGISIEDLASANGVGVGETLHPGQKLKVNIERTVATSAKPTGREHHIVVSGDTLWHIARRYGVSVDALRRANGLHARSKLMPGQLLSIPTQN